MKKYYLTQLTTLFLGNLVAWKAVYDDFARYFSAGGKLLDVAGCTVPNPVTTPCFYGAFGFLGTLAWTWVIFKKKDLVAQVRQQKYLSWFLVGCALFGGFNFTKLYLDYMYGSQIGCSGAPMTTPFATPCFYGASLFLAALIVSWVVLHKEMKAAHG